MASLETVVGLIDNLQTPEQRNLERRRYARHAAIKKVREAQRRAGSLLTHAEFAHVALRCSSGGAGSACSASAHCHAEAAEAYWSRCWRKPTRLRLPRAEWLFRKKTFAPPLHRRAPHAAATAAEVAEVKQQKWAYMSKTAAKFYMRTICRGESP